MLPRPGVALIRWDPKVAPYLQTPFLDHPSAMFCYEMFLQEQYCYYLSHRNLSASHNSNLVPRKKPEHLLRLAPSILRQLKDYSLIFRRGSPAIPASPEPNKAMLPGSGTLIPVTNPILSIPVAVVPVPIT